VGKTNEFFSMAESMIGGPGRYIRAGKTNTGDKNNSFFAETLPKLRFYGRSTFLVIMQLDRWVRREG
jgi:hypothetical protein